MRHLLLFRHAEAVHSPKFRDHERPLTATGRETAARIGAFLAESAQKLDLVIVSDALRTRESWEIASARLSVAPEVKFERKLYNAERHDIMEAAREMPEKVAAALIVSHNPGVSDFAAQFAGSGDRDALSRMSRGFPPGGLAIFAVDAEDWRKLRWGGGALTAFLT